MIRWIKYKLAKLKRKERAKQWQELYASVRRKRGMAIVVNKEDK